MKSTLTISVCTIVKDERDRIVDLLSSLIGFADEVVIVDTGSTDDTIDCIEAFISEHPVAPIRLLTYAATGGFHYGLAKNFSIDQATGEYVIVLDADERLSDEFKKTVRHFLSEERPFVASVVRKDELLPHLIDYPERIILRESGIRYGEGAQYKVHEQLVHTAQAKPFRETVWHQQRWNHYVVRPQRILLQLEIQIDRTAKTKTLLGHWLRAVWYCGYRFNKIYFKRGLYKDGRLGFKYAFMRAVDAFLIEFFVGLKPREGYKYWEV